MSTYKKYELISNNEVVEYELDNIIAYDKVNNLYVVGILSFFGTLIKVKNFKALKKARRYFESLRA